MTAKTARFPGNAQTSEVRACMRMCTCACTCMQPCLNPTQHTDLPAYEKDSKRMCACISSDAPHGANHCTPKAAAADKVRPAWGHGRSRPLSAPVARPLVCVHVHACMHAGEEGRSLTQLLSLFRSLALSHSGILGQPLSAYTPRNTPPSHERQHSPSTTHVHPPSSPPPPTTIHLTARPPALNMAGTKVLRRAGFHGHVATVGRLDRRLSPPVPSTPPLSRLLSLSRLCAWTRGHND